MHGMISRIFACKNAHLGAVASRRPLLTLACIVAVLIWPAAAMAAAGDGPPLQPHLAVYDLTLAHATDRSGVKSATGRMVIDLGGNPCEGWTLNFRLVVQYGLKSGKERLLDSRSTSWEAGDSSELRYVRRQYVNNRLQDDISLTARLGRNGKPGMIALTKPDKQTVALPAGVLFPVAHQTALNRAARAGEQRFQVLTFDGGDGATVYDTIAFIGKELAKKDYGGSVEGTDAAKLKSLRAWPVSISYFKHGGTGEETPTYQVSFALFDNGVSGDMRLDYGDFALAAKLARVDFHKRQPCP